MLIKFLTSSYRSLVGLAAWGFLIIAFLVGLFVGRYIGEMGYISWNMGLTILSGVLFSFVALIIEVILIPPFMVLFTIDARVKFIEDKLKDQQSEL